MIQSFYPRVYDQVRLDVKLFKVWVSQMTIPLLHLIRFVQVLQSRLCDVNPANGENTNVACYGDDMTLMIQYAA